MADVALALTALAEHYATGSSNNACPTGKTEIQVSRLRLATQSSFGTLTKFSVSGCERVDGRRILVKGKYSVWPDEGPSSIALFSIVGEAKDRGEFEAKFPVYPAGYKSPDGQVGTSAYFPPSTCISVCGRAINGKVGNSFYFHTEWLREPMNLVAEDFRGQSVEGLDAVEVSENCEEPWVLAGGA